MPTRWVVGCCAGFVLGVLGGYLAGLLRPAPRPLQVTSGDGV